MGWDASEIMDAAVKAVDDMLESAYLLLGVDPDRVTLHDIQDGLDDALRPHVRNLASMLEDRGWDTQEESAYFHRFPQEMLVIDDGPFEEYLRKQLAEMAEEGSPESIMVAAQHLQRHIDKNEEGNN